MHSLPWDRLWEAQLKAVSNTVTLGNSKNHSCSHTCQVAWLLQEEHAAWSWLTRMLSYLLSFCEQQQAHCSHKHVSSPPHVISLWQPLQLSGCRRRQAALLLPQP